MEEQVVLTNEKGENIGLMGKTEAHEKGVLHQAISILIFNAKKEMLIQQRAFEKYHWAGIWSNSCCSHPRNEESFAEAANRRLFEELGFSTVLMPQFQFIYQAKDEVSGLTEHEYDAVFTGIYNDVVPFNKTEVNAIKWISIPDLLADIENSPASYSFWFKIILKEFLKRGMI